MLLYRSDVLVATLAEISEGFGSQWKTKCALLPDSFEPNQGYDIKFKATRGSTYQTDIGIDNVALEESCPRKNDLLLIF